MDSQIAKRQPWQAESSGSNPLLSYLLHRRAQVEVKAVELLRHREQLEGSGKSQAVRLDELARKEAEVAQREGEVKVGRLSSRAAQPIDQVTVLACQLCSCLMMLQLHKVTYTQHIDSAGCQQRRCPLIWERRQHNAQRHQQHHS